MVSRRARVFWLLLGLFSAGLGPTAYADGTRCGTQLVGTGDTLYTVRSRCGEPAFATQRTELRTQRVWVNGPCVTVRGSVVCGRMEERTVEVVVDQWTYDFGPNRFVQTLTFEQGVVVAVVSGDYGSKT